MSEEGPLGQLIMHYLLLAPVVRPVVQMGFVVVVVVVVDIRYVVILAKTFHDALETFKEQFLADTRMFFQTVSDTKSLLASLT